MSKDLPMPNVQSDQREASMAEASIAISRMGRVSASREFADVIITVRFWDGEVRLNLDYFIHLAIVEKDEDLDQFLLFKQGPLFGLNLWNLPPANPDDVVHRTRARGNPDEFIFFTRSDPTGSPGNLWSIRPGGRREHTIERTIQFDVGDMEAGPEEYVALVWVVPEIMTGQGVSREFSINLG
jgi:hypothetical protein